ncbi:aerobic respiration control sensor protein ArcB [bacterium BMS3Bbin02]|nr:aerobic respiration control sensor protein ArcB [bacterium BMS3Bbin02]
MATFTVALDRLETNTDAMSVVKHYSGLIEALDQADSMRRQVLDLDVTWSESLTFYSDLVEQFSASYSGLMRMVRVDAELTTIFMGFLDVSDAEGAAHIERVLVAKVLTVGTIERSELDLLGRLAGLQEASLKAFNDHVPVGLRAPYQTDRTSAEMDWVAAVRTQLASGDLSVDPGVWFDTATISIDNLYEIETGLLDDLGARTRELANQGRAAMWWFLGFGILVLVASLLVAVGVGRRLSKRTVKLTQVAHAIQDGDFSQQADVNVGDELGTLAVAFNQMTDDLTSVNRTLETRVQERTSRLTTSEARVRAMLEAIPDLIFRLNTDGTYVDFIHGDLTAGNGSRIFPPPETFVGKHINEVLAPELASEFISASQRAHRSGDVELLEYQFPMPGDLRDREARIVAIPDSDETMVVVRDITERKSAENHLRELVRSKDEFIASVSHELRTPLTAVIGFAELLRDTGANLSPGESEEMIRSITEQASDIANIVEDLLVAARAEIDTLHVNEVPVHLRAQLTQVLETTRVASPHQIEIVGQPVIALADPGRVRQILRNLLTNAARYGGTHIQIRMHSDGSSAFLQVCDDGPGVPEHDSETIFEPYRRSHVTPGRPGSVGLGLTVSRTLARLMGGDLTYRYDNGISIFELTLPVSDDSSSPSDG